ncbi:DUF2955 domain-containing protein [Variovorax sp. J22R115]|uniref:DUF2955 domain-containing protein n=1 Tax=Variovorax sp. J22R115 TaxID=3053509 RepID=UPI002578337C|nr:DUF2955 domain-containing protein [Variovorax sp. J22R115]MDM0053959.1 DUF2955 domain-containing protein [Variovorax sp. J22R115]
MSIEKRRMGRADKAVLRLAIGLVLAVLVAYGLALKAPYAVCVVAVLILCKPGPPIPLFKGMVLALVIAVLMMAGVLMVPVLENYALTGVLLTGVLLYAVFYSGVRSANPLATILVMAIALIPVVGVVEQALALQIGATLAVGLCIGVLVSGISHALFPDPPVRAGHRAAAEVPTRESASWIALRAVVVVMPVFVLALTNPSFYVAAIMKSVALGQQAGSTSTRSAGQELVGSTLMGAAIAGCLWFGLALRPNLWMLMLWMAAAALWVGTRLFRVRPGAFPPSFWVQSLVTMLLLLGPAIEDSAGGKDVLKASATRVALFVAVALYAWVTVWALEHWRTARSHALFFRQG